MWGLISAADSLIVCGLALYNVPIMVKLYHMIQKLIIMRGNSGSGKSTVASRARALSDKKSDAARTRFYTSKNVKKENDGPIVAELIGELTLYAKRWNYDTVIIEGILPTEKYGDILKGLLSKFDESYVFYLDIPFEETVRRHRTRNKSHEFDENDMKKWWCEKDYLGVDDEQILGENYTEDELVDKIFDIL